MNEHFQPFKDHLIKLTEVDKNEARKVWGGIDVILNQLDAFGLYRPTAAVIASRLPDIIDQLEQAHENSLDKHDEFSDTVVLTVEAFFPNYFMEIATDPDYHDVRDQIVSYQSRPHPLVEIANQYDVSLKDLSLDEYLQLWFVLKRLIF